MQIATHVEQDPLFQRVVEDDPQAIEQFAAKIQSDDGQDTPEQVIRGTGLLDPGDDGLGHHRNPDQEERHADCHHLYQGKQERITEKVLRDAPDDFHEVYELFELIRHVSPERPFCQNAFGK